MQTMNTEPRVPAFWKRNRTMIGVARINPLVLTSAKTHGCEGYLLREETKAINLALSA